MGSYENASGGFSLGEGYIDPEDGSAREIKQFQDSFYQKSYPANAAYWAQGFVDTRFEAGDQSLWTLTGWGDGGSGTGANARRWFFNRIRRQTNMITGYQRLHRKSTVTVPNFDGDKLADDYNGVLEWCDQRDGFQEYQSQAFAGCVTTGMSFLHMYPDFTFDPISGDLFTDYVAWCNVLVDPYFRKQDLSDCGGIWRRRWVNSIQAQALLPGRAKEIAKMRPSGMKDGRFPLQAELLSMSTNQLFAYDEFHYRTTREATIILDPYTQEATEWENREDESEDELKEILRNQPWLIVKKTQVPTVKLAISLSGRMLYHGSNLLRVDTYPFVPYLCYHLPDLQSYAWRTQGVVRGLRDCQWLYNLRKVIELQILQSQINSGWIYKVDRVVDPKALRQSGEGYIVPLKSGDAPINDSIQRIEAAGIPSSVIELSKILGEEFSVISGVNEELLGAAKDDKPGILAITRQGAGLVTLQPIFDRLDYSQRLYGALRLQAIRKNFSKGKIAAILGREPDPRFWTAHAQKYSVTVEEGNFSPTQRQMELAQLLHFKQIGMTVADKTIWRAAFLTNKAQAEQDAAEQAQQQQQAQAQQAQTQAQAENAKIMASYAKARSDLALERERMASASEKEAQVENVHADAERKKIESELGLVKLMLELEDLDFNNLSKSFTIAQSIKSSKHSPTPNLGQFA